MSMHDYGASAYVIPFEQYIELLIPFDSDRAIFYKRMKGKDEGATFWEDVLENSYCIPDKYLEKLSVNLRVPEANLERPDSERYDLVGTEIMEFDQIYATWQIEDILEPEPPKQQWVLDAEKKGISPVFERWVVSG
jgi:hypothetical protein